MKNELMTMLIAMYHDGREAVEVLADKNKAQDLLDLLTYVNEVSTNDYVGDLLKATTDFLKYGNWGALERFQKYLDRVVHEGV